MIPTDRRLVQRIEVLERHLGWMRITTLFSVLCLSGVFLVGASSNSDEPRELTVTRLVVVDDEGRPRVVIGEDAKDTDRVSRAAGITLHDMSGAERAGFSTMTDNSVVLALDAPAGVGSPMRDRIGLKVYPNGGATVSLIGNDTGIPVQLLSEPEGGGGVEFLDYDLDKRLVFIKRVDFQGETIVEESLDGP